MIPSKLSRILEKSSSKIRLMHKKPEVGVVICHSKNWDLDGTRAKNVSQMKKNLRRSNLTTLDFESIVCQNWAEAAFNLQRFGISSNRISHPLLWRYIPQTNTYLTIGQFSESGFSHFENFTANHRPGEIGVILSFLKACEIFLASELKYLVWCEDDANLNPDFGSELEKLLSFELPNFDFIRLVDEGAIEVKDIFKISSLPITYPTSYSNCQIVLISRNGAEKFRSYIETFGAALPLDWIIYNVQSDKTRRISFNSFFINPNKLTLGTFDSSKESKSLIRFQNNHDQFPKWFNFSAHNFDLVPIRPVSGDEGGIRVLQIGVFTGDVTEWLLMNRSISQIHDVDTWEGSGEEHSKLDFAQVELFYDSRCLGTPLVEKFKMTSNTFFGTKDSPEADRQLYDFIYVDGDHTAIQTAIDCLNSFRYLKVGGVLAMDDYMWNVKGERFLEPKLGVDAFLSIVQGRYELLVNAYQLWIRKIM